MNKRSNRSLWILLALIALIVVTVYLGGGQLTHWLMRLHGR